VSQAKGFYTVQDPTLYTNEWLVKQGYTFDVTPESAKKKPE
jgi:hypothetical protein